MKELYEDAKNRVPVENPKPGDKGVAQFAQDEEFYRCVVSFRATLLLLLLLKLLWFYLCVIHCFGTLRSEFL